MNTGETIVSISTPVGRGGIGIVRLSGRDAIRIADKIFRSSNRRKLRQTASHRIVFGHVIDPVDKEIVDEVLVSLMRAPKTYTREDTVEINCHSGPIPLRRILETVLNAGAKPASPGEFTQRAFLNGRIDLAQAEAVLDVINSLTVQSQRAAVQQLRGSLSRKIEGIRDSLTDLAAFVEAYIDFPEEDIEPPSLKEMKKMAASIRRPLKKLIDGSRYGLILREGLKTAIAGRPNVGKSSLLNALLEHDRAIVTELPGTTRDVIEEHLNIKGLPIRIMDTAGIRDVKNIAEKEGVKRSLRTMEDADLVLIVLDGSRTLHATDRELVRKSDPENTIFVINKSDLPGKISASTLSSSKTGKGDLRRRTLKISAKKGTGIEKLKEKIVETALHGRADTSAGIVTNARHVHALEKALLSIDSFVSGVKANDSPEFLSVELRDALDAIGEILGITTPEDILDRIFSSFCIGK
jgi:tRNA modification GTPase